MQGACSHLAGSSSTELRPFVVPLTTSDLRSMQVRVWPPGQACEPCDTIIFSHGHSLGNRQYDRLLSTWARAGYLILAPLHSDSESHPKRGDFDTEEYLRLRLSDFETLVRGLTDVQSSMLFDVDVSGRYIAAGHSFGALLAQMAGGARVAQRGQVVSLEVATLPLGIIAISPPGPVDGYLSAEGWSHLQVPQLVVTGTRDTVPLFAPDWNAHLASFEAGPAGRNFSLVFANMDHYFNGAFGRIKTLEVATTAAVGRLNREALRFANALRANQTISAAAWSALTTADVQARTR